jgi:hypothetical protein
MYLYKLIDIVNWCTANGTLTALWEALRTIELSYNCTGDWVLHSIDKHHRVDSTIGYITTGYTVYIVDRNHVTIKVIVHDTISIVRCDED